MTAKILSYIGFVVLFWGSFYYLARIEWFSENIALIATSIGTLPLLILFAPPFTRLVDRLGSIKIPGVELEFQRAIEESIHDLRREQITLTIDTGKGVEYVKDTLPKFTDLVKKWLPQRTTQLVIIVDLKDSEKIYLRMLYFQSRILKELFDLRAFLFVDATHEEVESRLIGTIPIEQSLELIDKYFGGLDEAYKSAVQQHKSDFLKDGNVEHFIYSTWYLFSDSVKHPAGKFENLERGVFGVVFGKHIERNIISYPLTKKDYLTLFTYLEPNRQHLILVQEDKILKVRTIDQVARGIVRSVIQALVAQKTV